jgi:hypothetical protein
VRMDPNEPEKATPPQGRHRGGPKSPFSWGYGSDLPIFLAGLVLMIGSVGYGVDRIRGCGGTCQQSVPLGLLFALGPFLLVAVGLLIIFRRK